MDLTIAGESVVTDSALPRRSPSLSSEPRTLASPVVPPGPQSPGLQEPQSPVGEDADCFLLQNTVFSIEDWEHFLRKDKNLGHIWKKAAEREVQQRLLRCLIIAVALLGLLGGIVSEQLGLWSLRAAVGQALETVTQQVARLSGTLIAPEAVGGRNQEQQEAPLSRQALPATTYGNKKANTEIAVTPSPQRRARQAEGNELLAPSGAVSGAPATPDPLLPNGQSSTTALAQRVGEEKAAWSCSDSAAR